jgi:dTDP-4-amino-4,6-dideoxygalactose transaminase
VLSLPCDPAMDDTRIRYVVDAMKQHFAKAN